MIRDVAQGVMAAKKAFGVIKKIFYINARNILVAIFIASALAGALFPVLANVSAILQGHDLYFSYWDIFGRHRSAISSCFYMAILGPLFALPALLPYLIVTTGLIAYNKATYNLFYLTASVIAVPYSFLVSQGFITPMIKGLLTSFDYDEFLALWGFTRDLNILLFTMIGILMGHIHYSLFISNERKENHP